MSILLIIIFAILAFLITCSAMVFVVGPIMLLHPNRRGEHFYQHRGMPISPSQLGLPFDDFRFTASDGESQLSAWFIPAAKPIGTIIYLHGVADNKMAGLLLAKVFYDHQFNVLIYDSRAHGESGGRYCTYGYHEKYDVQQAIIAVRKIGQEKNIVVGNVGVFGTSMGAAIAIQTASIEPRIRAIVSEAAFATLRQITVDYQKRLMRLPWHFLRNIAMKRSETIAQFKHREVSPLASVSRIHAPIFFIHGIEDRFIKYQYTQELFIAANEPKEVWFVAGAKHSDVHEIGGKEYEERIAQFFVSHLTAS
ncbi:MAG: alpha/beta hydrolase [Bacteriovoracaceae bacterium]|nr:alpha/beta hydrolase [Bacteroidota bacterium]